MNQVILVSDKKGNHTGEYIDKDLAHSGRGKRHLAITVLLYNNKGQVLLQHRKHKIHSDIWDFTGSTHHLHKNGGSDETTEEATYRCLKVEYGIAEKIPLKVLGGVNYFAADGNHCENEHDIIVAGEFNGKLKPNRQVAYKHEWVNEKIFLTDISKNSKKYAPWAVLASKLLKDFKIKSDFEAILEEFLKEFEPYKNNYLKKEKTKLGRFSQKYNFIDDLAQFMTGGKKLRAFLVYLGYLCAGGEKMSEVMPVSLAFEILHSFFLMHDDVIDRSDLRRGALTIHKKYGKKDCHFGESMAILWGDLAAFEAVSLIVNSNLESSKKQEALTVFIDTVLSTGWGQVLDVLGSVNKLNVADITRVNDLKTAKYSIISPLVTGAMLAKPKKSQISAMEMFGLYAGRAFQLQDDYLGVFGDEKIIGKSVLSDMREGKNTLLINKVQEMGTAQDRKTIDSLWGKNNATVADLEKIKQVILKSGASVWCDNEMQKLNNSAHKYIKQMTGNVRLQKIIGGMADFIVARSR